MCFVLSGRGGGVNGAIAYPIFCFGKETSYDRAVPGASIEVGIAIPVNSEWLIGGAVNKAVLGGG